MPKFTNLLRASQFRDNNNESEIKQIRQVILLKNSRTQVEILDPKICQYFWKKIGGKAIRARGFKTGHL